MDSVGNLRFFIIKVININQFQILIPFLYLYKKLHRGRMTMAACCGAPCSLAQWRFVRARRRTQCAQVSDSQPQCFPSASAPPKGVSAARTY